MISTTHSSIGLSESRHADGRRHMFDLINSLRSTGVQTDIDIPMIAVIGSQSAGKSSLIESISDIMLPRASGTCTRCPTECKLEYSTEPWKCVVSLRFITDEHGQDLGQFRNETFGDPIFDKAKTQDRIRRAQLAILNPSTDFHHFLEAGAADPECNELTFSTNCVSLQISGNNVADLSFCDLPGLIATTRGGTSNDVELVENLVTSYISKPNCIILLTVACETEFDNQRAHRLAQKYDSEGKRTVGVLTKPDRIPTGDEIRWLPFIKNEDEALEHGWFSVKQPDSRAIAAGITWEDARRQEHEYFSSTSPWSSLDVGLRSHLGTAQLVARLSDVLSDLIVKRLPELQEELHDLLEKTEESLRQLPEPPSDEPIAKILQLVGGFSRDLSKHLEGITGGGGLLQKIRPETEQFRKAILESVPDFRPYRNPRNIMNMHGPVEVETSSTKPPPLEPPTFLSNEEPCVTWHGDEHAIYVEEVLKKAQDAITRELPDHLPFVVSSDYISAITAQWDAPTRRLFASVQDMLSLYVRNLVKKHFGKYMHGGLHQQVMLIVANHIKKCAASTSTRLDWLLEVEKRPTTLNSHHYHNYKDRFLDYFHMHQRGGGGDALAAKLKAHRPSNCGPGMPSLLIDFDKQILRAQSALSDLGIRNVDSKDLARLCPANQYEPALNIMATVRAYFQLAYKRFVDYVPMAIDHELILGLNRDGALEETLRAAQGVSRGDEPARGSREETRASDEGAAGADRPSYLNRVVTAISRCLCDC
ncbi:Interferon-induced GTP-binding protein Mx2 [Grifola frondosa]|uniref:Interferon-induced GTP-binding protein Mx2 n=1 Tax=Grifola frondosa TaxID=5627 RepID=A0A1C7LNV3_GRIFR|nr:Interferon-induced GTP-binding protein Mx2 [Grifola frondosa]